LARVPLKDALKVDGWRTMDAAIRSYVRSPHLRQLFGRFATYVGASPFQAPATLNVIAHVELAGGVWYPQGGVYAIAAALEKLARELGVEIHPGCAAQQIAVANGRAQGVTLADGQGVPAAAVIANVDVYTAAQTLLPPDLNWPAARPEPSCSGFILLLGVNKNHPALAHHNIFFSGHYRREFDDIFGRGLPPDEPTIYAAITSKTNADHAPAGHENWFVLVNAPALGANFDWEAGAAAYRDRVLARLAHFGFDLRPHIEVEQIITPAHLARHTGAWRGALYGASSNSRWAAFKRPHNRDPHLRGLYYAGGTTHPGGGVPMVMLSGKVAAELMLEE
jgi:phytoene desaturase